MIERDTELLELPKGWVWTRLEDVCLDPQYGWTTSAAEKGLLHLLRTTDITSGVIDWDSVPFCRIEPPEKQKYLLKDGDIVISRAGSVGYSYLIKTPRESIFASYLIRFRPLTDELYLAYFLKSPAYWESISEKSLGIAIPNVNASKLRTVNVPLPPLPEQHRIVAKIEELFTRLDAGVGALKKIQLQLKRYRQSVLKSAFEGRLTAEWREAHKDELEPASALLERIKTERKKGGKYKELPPLDTADLPELPEGWVWTQAFDLAFIITKGSTPTTYGYNFIEKGINFIKVENLGGGVIDKESIQQFISEEAHNNFKRSQLMEEDILFSIAGTIGKVSIVSQSDLPANTNQAISLIRCPWQLINNKYLYYCLQSPIVRLFLVKRPRGVGMNNVSLGDVNEIPISLPTLGEQKQIIEEIERCLSVADKIEDTINQSLKQAERLRQSILKRAFEGQLVPQDPSDEPAEKLLERIRAEKAKNQTNTKRRRAVNAK